MGNLNPPIGSSANFNYAANGNITSITLSNPTTGNAFATITQTAPGQVSAQLSTPSYTGGGTFSYGDGVQAMLPGGLGQSMYNNEITTGQNGLGITVGTPLTVSFENGQVVGVTAGPNNGNPGFSIGQADFANAGLTLSGPTFGTTATAAGMTELAPVSRGQDPNTGAQQQITVSQGAGSQTQQGENALAAAPNLSGETQLANNGAFTIGSNIRFSDFSGWFDVKGSPNSTYILASGDPNNPQTWQAVADPKGNVAATTTDQNGNGALVTGALNMYGTGSLLVIDAGTNQVVGSVALGQPTADSVNGNAQMAPLNVDFTIGEMGRLGYSHPYQALQGENGMINARTYTGADGKTYVTQDTHSTTGDWRVSEMMCKMAGNVFDGNMAQYFPPGWSPDRTVGQNIAVFNAMTTAPNGTPVCPFLGEFQTLEGGQQVNMGLMAGSMLIPAGIISGNKVFENAYSALHNQEKIGDITIEELWHNYTPWFQITTFNSLAEERAYANGS